jgi:hypothetical protein
LHVHQDYHRDDTFGEFRWSFLAIQTVPVAFGIVATVIAISVGVVFLTVGVVDGVARLERLLAVASVEETLRIVAVLVANSVHEDFPTSDGRGAIRPRIDTQRTVVTVEFASVTVAFFVATTVAALRGALVLVALLSLLLLLNKIHYQTIVVINIFQTKFLNLKRI